jgi:hypothetical protein
VCGESLASGGRKNEDCPEVEEEQEKGEDNKEYGK